MGSWCRLKFMLFVRLSADVARKMGIPLILVRVL